MATVAPRAWLIALVARSPVNVAAAAVAYKTARAAWAMLTCERRGVYPSAAPRRTVEGPLRGTDLQE